MNTTTFSSESNTLFPIEVETSFSEVLREGFALIHKNPEILKKIERDLDIHGIEKKEKRNADRAWRDNHTRSPHPQMIVSHAPEDSCGLCF